MKKLILLFIILFPKYCFGQISSKIRPETFEKYSLMLNLIEKDINEKNTSYLVFPNSELNTLPIDLYKSIFEQKNEVSIGLFTTKIKINQILNSETLNNIYSLPSGQNVFISKSNKSFYVSKNLNSFLLCDHYDPKIVTSESIINEIIILENNVSLILLQGVLYE